MRKWIFTHIDEDSDNRFAKVFNALIVFMILASIIAIILESFANFNTLYSSEFKRFEFFSVIIFTIEYLLRLFTADYKYKHRSKLKAFLKYPFTALAIIDLLAILPFYLPLFVNVDLRFLRAIRLFRLMRIFKLGRYFKSFKLFTQIFKDRKEELYVTLFITCILMVIASSLMYYIEHDAQPEAFPNILASFWWAIATLTTVGYGDVYPITAWGKFISGIIALLGIGMVALPAGILSSAFIEKINPDEGNDYNSNSSNQIIEQRLTDAAIIGIKKGVDLETISSMTKLPIERLEQLKDAIEA